MSIIFRKVKASEIDVKVSKMYESGASLILYKDARVDQNILDESVGNTRWQKHHRVEGDFVFCNIAIYDEESKQWIEKEDVGDCTFETNEATKAIISDSCKRAGVAWGIGRELYTAPNIFFEKSELKNLEYNEDGQCICYDRFVVTDIKYDENGSIQSVNILNKNTKIEKFFSKTTRYIVKRSSSAPAAPASAPASEPAAQQVVNGNPQQTQQPVERYLPFK
jgi:Uncharacterized protein conserved in bacteria